MRSSTAWSDLQLGAPHSFDHLNLIPRPRLTEWLRAAVAQHTLTILAAPLGAGKSAALALAFADDAASVRLAAQPWHRGAFVPALVHTIRALRADFGRRTLGALASGLRGSPLGRTFGADLRHNDSPLLIVIDNADVAYDDPEFAHFFLAALEALPSAVRLVLAGRARPPFDLLDAFARGQATVMRNDVFRFRRDEIAALAQRDGRKLDASELAQIESATDGWVTAIVLALKFGSSIGPAMHSPDAAAAYIEATILEPMSAQTRIFLENAAVFETLDVGVLADSPFFANAREILTDLERRGAFVFELTGQGQYRLHPILRDIALRRLIARGGACAAHSAAADAYVRKQAIAAALYHVVKSNDGAIAARFLRANAIAATETGDRARLRAAAALIEPDGVDADIAAFVRGLDEKAAGSPQVRVWFARAAAAAQRSGDDAIGFFARAQVIEYDLGRLRQIDAYELARLRTDARILGPLATAAADVLCGWEEAIQYNFGAAYDRMLPLTRGGEAGSQFNPRILLAYVQTALGKFDDSETTLDELVASLEGDDRVVLQALALVWFARLALARGNTNVASDAAAHAERLANGLDFHAEEAALYIALAEVATHRGDVAGSIAHAERARDRASNAWYIADTARIRAFAELVIARAAFTARDNAIARSLALRVVDLPNIPSATRALALTEAAVYTLFCEPHAAGDLIAQARAVARAAEPVDIGDAAALVSVGDVLAFLTTANGEPAMECYPLPGPFDAFVTARRGLMTLELAGIAVGNARRGHGSREAVALALDRYARHGPRFEARLARVYASRFIRDMPPSIAPVQRLDLTLREHEILKLLVDGLTNKEIAQSLALSPRTVETHVERVLSKLYVGSRSRAIAKALRLGLVDLEPAV